MVAVIPFTRGAPTVVDGCLDVRGPRLPLARWWFLGGEACAVVLEEMMILHEVLCELLVCLSCTSSRDTPPRGSCGRRALVLVDEKLAVLM